MGQWIDEQATVRAVTMLQALDVHQWETVRELVQARTSGNLSRESWETATSAVIERAAYKADAQVQASARPGR